MFGNKTYGGQRVKLSAADMNAWQDAARLAKSGQRILLTEPPDPRSVTLALVRNDSGANQPRFAVLGLNGPIISTTANLTEWKERLTFKGILPTAVTHSGKFCVLLEPLANGRIGTAAVGGVVPVRITGTAGTTWVDVATGVTTLAAGTSGSAQVLDQESGSGTRWAVVRLLGKAAAAGTTGFTARKNSTGSTFGPRERLNLIEGNGIGLTVADDAGNNEIDVTIASSLILAHVYRDTGITLTSGAAQSVSFTDVVVDSGFFSGGSPTRLTAPISAYYVLRGEVFWELSGHTTAGSVLDYGVSLRLNGGSDIAGTSRRFVSDPTANTAVLETMHIHTGPLVLSAGDYVEMRVLQTNSPDAANGSVQFKAHNSPWLHIYQAF